MEDLERNIELRRTAKFRLLKSPNYFGNLSDTEIPDLPPAVEQKVEDTAFEELTCVGYHPDNDILTAIVEIKQPAGYSGGLCTAGSYQYVRFYADYGNGVWVDHGVASFNIHDLGHQDDLCYGVSIELDPSRRSCCDDAPVLPTVRAILSWSIEPPPNTPNWLPVWGNRLERAIQVDPRNPIICKFLDIFDEPGIGQVDADLLSQLKEIIGDKPPVVKPAAPIGELMEKAHDEDELHVLRNVFPAITKVAADKTDVAAYAALEGLKQFDIDLSAFDDFILEPNFNTSYEELHCVGLDRDLNALHGVVQIKRRSGFSGDLCTKGSREYIAFYLDFGSGWEYQGTTWVEVHDIPSIPEGGLWYQASLPVDLDDERKEWCETGRARIRGILSWASAPPPNEPEYVAHWGDWEDCWIELRPLPKGVEPGRLTPFLEAIGSMPVDQIDGAGFANGSNIGGTLTADESPLGGVIKLAGHVAFSTSNNLEYRVMLMGPSDASPKPWTKSFFVTVTTVIGGTISTASVMQIANGDWFEYIPQAGPVYRTVAGNLLARFANLEEGLHTVFIQIREAGSTTILAASAIEAFFVDNTRPNVDVEITSGAGNCGKFAIGDVLSGTYSMSDLHSGSLSLSITPAAEAAGGHLSIISVSPVAPLPPPAPTPTASNRLSYAALTLDNSGATGTWELDTTGMDPCGYNIRIHGEDRTIVNSGSIGWERSDIEGFCLEE